MNKQNTAIVTLDHEQILTTSLLVAEKFDKRHDNVLREIQKIIETCPDKQFNALNFEAVNYTDAKGEKRPAYKLTRDGFVMLAMGFTGKKAFLWKIAFINAFNRMDAQLNALQDTEHHAMLDQLFARHPQWRETGDLRDYGFSTREIAGLQQKHPRNVQKMLARMRLAGIARAPTPKWWA